MNLSHLSFYSQYCKSPITIFHKIKTSYKVIITYTFLFFIPYFNYIYLLVFILLSIFINFCILHQKKQMHIKSILSQSIMYIIILIYYLYVLKYSDAILSKYIKYIQINFFKPYFLYKNQNIYFIIKQHTKYNIPAIILKTLFVNLLSIEIIQILNLSTKYELIILNLKNLLSKINLCKSKKKYQFVLIILFTAKFIERVIYTIYILYLSIKVKYYYFIDSNHFSYIVQIIIYRYITSIHYDTHILAYNLWNKKNKCQSC